MGRFLEEIDKFYGTGERNARGETLEEFLEAYDPYKYETPSATTDAVICAYQGERPCGISDLKVLLVKRSNHPSIGCWALPGGFVEMKENLEDGARRELEEETGVKGLVMEQIGAYGDYDRDPRTRVITTAYLALVRESEVTVRAGDDAADAAWCETKLVLEEERWEGEVHVRRYRLCLRNEERGVSTEAVVEERSREGLIRERKFTVREQGETASDHAAILVHGLRILEERLRTGKNA